MYKNLPRLLLVLSCCYSLTLPAQVGSKYEQLVYVNQKWKNQPDANPAFSKQAATTLPEQQLIQLHLQETEKLLRSRKPDNLSATQLANRLKNLDVLHQYWQAGVFPKNTQHSNRQPYFIDDYNTYCAVGYLMKMSGADEMVKAIHSTQNFNYLADIQHPDLMQWAHNSGLTLDELALIQPGYGGEWPAAIIEMHYNNTGQDVGEYIEVHQSNGQLIGMATLTGVSFYDHMGVLYKTVSVAQMQAISFNYVYFYQFPANESFADSGKIVLSGNGPLGAQVISNLYYNSSGTRLEDYNIFVGGNPSIRQFAGKEDETTPVGSSLTFCGLYTTTWNPSVLPAGVGTVNPCTVGALPISLLSFNYTVQNKSVQLAWQTATETNNDRFELQRSSDGINFTNIGTVKGAGTSNLVNNYSFTDNQPNYLNHYRLKQVDKDGKFSYSKILFVKFAKSNPLIVIQNPVKQTLQLQVNNAANKASLTIYDFSGRAVVKAVAKEGNQSINVAALAAGKYVLQLVTNDGQVFSRQFVKQ